MEPAVVRLTIILHVVTPFIHPCKKNKNKTDQLKNDVLATTTSYSPTAFGDKSQNRTMVAMCDDLRNVPMQTPKKKQDINYQLVVTT